MIDEAIQQYEKQMEDPKFTKHLQKHPQYVSMYVTKGVLLMDALLNNPNETYYAQNALNTFNYALRLQEYHDAPSVIQKAEIQCFLGRVNCGLKKTREANKMFKDAYKTIELWMGENHPLMATLQANWSRVYYEEGKIKEAIEKLNKAWIIRNKFLRSDIHPNPLVYAYYLAKYYNQIEDFENAAHWYSVTINGYSYLVSKENIRVENLNEPHNVLQKNKLPICNTWYLRIKECKECYDRLPII